MTDVRKSKEERDDILEEKHNEYVNSEYPDWMRDAYGASINDQEVSKKDRKIFNIVAYIILAMFIGLGILAWYALKN